jgi:hypothetical protein
MTLEELGWSAFFAEAFAAHRDAGLVPEGYSPETWAAENYIGLDLLWRLTGVRAGFGYLRSNISPQWNGYTITDGLAAIIDAYRASLID